MAKNEQSREANQPIWFDGKSINEALFCDDFLGRHKIIYTNGAFFTPDGRVTDELPLRGEIFEELKCCAVSNIPRKISNIVELMKLAALVEDFPPEADRIHLANGTLFLDGSFTEGKPDIVRCRLPVAYNPDAPTPTRWLAFLDGLLYPEDIPTLQEYIGYCLIPSNKGQRMMVIKGNGGEGKSQIGAVLSALFGSNMKDGSIGKISENRFARADLEHILLCVDDDMRMEALRQTNYVKSIVTAQGKMDLERKGKQSYQGWMCARLLAFSNGDLQALFDRSDGFYRRQLVLTAKEKPADRVDDPDLAEKMKAYYVKETSYYDQKTASFHTKVLALCPIMTRNDDFGDVGNKYPLFWVKYEDLAPFLAKQQLMTSNVNNAAVMSAEDYFTKNLYQGKIYKTNNMQGNTLAQYCPSDTAMAKEQKRIEAELAAFEKNIWGNQARKDSLDSIAKAEKNMDAKTLKKSRNRRSGSASKPAKTSTVKKRRSGGSNVSSGGSARVTVRRERH